MRYLAAAILFFLLAFVLLVQIEGCLDPLPERGIDTVIGGTP